MSESKESISDRIEVKLKEREIGFWRSRIFLVTAIGLLLMIALAVTCFYAAQYISF